MNDPDLFRLIANPHFLAKERIVKKKENNYLENHIHTKYPKLYVTPQLLKEIEVSIDKIINDFDNLDPDFIYPQGTSFEEIHKTLNNFKGILISESGIKNKEDILKITNKTNIKTFLIGESLLKNLDSNPIFSLL